MRRISILWLQARARIDRALGLVGRGRYRLVALTVGPRLPRAALARERGDRYFRAVHPPARSPSGQSGEERAAIHERVALRFHAALQGP